MAATNQSFTMYQGEKRSIQITVYDDATPPAPVDITAATFQFAFAKVMTEPPTFTKTSVSGITQTDSPGGVLEVAFLENDTKLLEGDWQWELVMTLAGEIKVVSAGTTTLLPSSIEHV